MAETAETAAPGNEVSISDETIEQSKTFIGQWNQLISTTNWGKGEIISQWRASLKDSNASVNEYSDEAWCQLVGGVTPQHVGRLRRTFDRFGSEYQDYSGLYWSHFYAALDWEDAEMWLEGAIQNKWSISQMRHQRWETLGSDPNDQPRTSDVVATELAEESQTLALSEQNRQNDKNYVEGPVHEGPDFGDEGSGDGSKSTKTSDGSPESSDSAEEPEEFVAKPFESFTDLPDDVLDAVNAFKIAIIAHKTNEWADISREDMSDLLDALKQLVRTTT
ncbi:hypothetical protein [Mariniblastus fucicola]|uniref:Uncharacterized protein n=1 Tax=Mariniblastus fucicola TaxID=980251 RepID=A0A5B9PBN7_9BACT|nr:hypothetical protein [Mariniblastus fucicola]QEG24117.1 hypothetical protein MFFC18_40330 [Mariniblastus fucicola]